jgi:hypothetical protein
MLYRVITDNTNNPLIKYNGIDKDKTIYVYKDGQRVSQVVCYREINQDYEEECDSDADSYFEYWFVPGNSFGGFLIGNGIYSSLEILIDHGYKMGYEFFIEV